MAFSNDIFYKNSEKGMIGEAIHEIIHFVRFYVWNREFQEFMRLAYEYFQNNEEEIREHIREFEAQFNGLSK